ncbi:bifunctional heparan sulfate N-deacetylase/N-sulfotransferase 4-like [Asterias rubens]|uniref:bifunctional heparan sulfate N-deacetylase/N-sulfotransferase 4-like n=1 Tax=Asterias rubens TaxID=7604 RepID=UPI001455C6C9|nr:bifunctional heparan sulfate N-deacetylase/N-sulfotransferase 4-like [Asterias rubens]
MDAICSAIMRQAKRYGTPRSLKKTLLFVAVVSSVFVWYLSYHMLPSRNVSLVKDQLEKSITVKDPLYSSQTGTRRATLPTNTTRVPSPFGDRLGTNRSRASETLMKQNITERDTWTNVRFNKTVEPTILVVTNQFLISSDLTNALKANNIKFDKVYASTLVTSWPALEDNDTGKYFVILFQSIVILHDLNTELLSTIYDYCYKYNAGIIAFSQQMSKTTKYKKLYPLPMTMEHGQSLRDISVNPTAGDVLHITKPGQGTRGSLPSSSWTVFKSDLPSYRPLVQAKKVTPAKSLNQTSQEKEILYATVLLDDGDYDGIQKIFIGNDLRFWLHYVLFLDSISYLSHGLLRTSLDRYIQVDIDDVFVGKNGRLTHLDVQALINQQQVLSNKVPGFTFKLGFSGRSFGSGNEDEKKGDLALAKNAHVFSWFPHMWGHAQAHTYDNRSKLVSEMKMNYQFAKSQNITVYESYAVAPHHSGVYPAHDMLYDAWKEVWGTKVTSTEEYPNLLPDWNRKGFIFKDIMVLPRKTCTLYTKNLLMSNYTGGKSGLDGVVRGGEVFKTVISNPISVFMTHMPNYARDRLGLYLFDELVTFIQRWTNIKLKTASPVKMAQMYFERHPEEREPKWMNPCSDKRHLQILPKLQSCDRLPQILVLGPQKTGTAALRAFMSLHPNLASNYPSKESFEEMQFFSNSKYYARGLEWYMSHFPQVRHNPTDKDRILFEKSATYFDSENAPKRAHLLLHKAKLITILIDPAKRAYSWYQHERAHENPASLNYTFYDVISASDGPGTHPKVVSLRNRCLNPGMYAKHVSSWLSHYSSKKMLVLDGELLKTDPVAVMVKVQQFLGLKRQIDYKDKIIFDKTKGFYCPVKSGRKHCLPKNKGRSYPPMDDKSKEFLRQFYQNYNFQLRNLLIKKHLHTPQWLGKD